jgi:hypothetical protein
MQLILEIEDQRASFVLELLGQLKGVSAKPLTNSELEAQLLKSEIQEAVANLNLVKKGKMQSKPLNVLLDEL